MLERVSSRKHITLKYSLTWDASDGSQQSPMRKLELNCTVAMRFRVHTHYNESVVFFFCLSAMFLNSKQLLFGMLSPYANDNLYHNNMNPLYSVLRRKSFLLCEIYPSILSRPLFPSRGQFIFAICVIHTCVL